jgi:two-component system OmpR family response regulator
MYVNSRRIVIAEDHADVRALLALILRRDGWIVRTAATGAEAIALLVDHIPDVMLLDLSMPQMDGWAVLARRAVESAWHSLPVIAMSADHQYADAVIDLGATAFLAKPFTIAQLRATLQRTVPCQ